MGIFSSSYSIASRSSSVAFFVFLITTFGLYLSILELNRIYPFVLDEGSSEDHNKLDDRWEVDHDDDTAKSSSSSSSSSFAFRDAGICSPTDCPSGHLRPRHYLQDVSPADVHFDEKWWYPLPHHPSNLILTRDPSLDAVISGSIQRGTQFDEHVHIVLARHLTIVRENRVNRTHTRETNTGDDGGDRHDHHHADAADSDHAVFVDVGANIGLFTSSAACMNATVIAFEPSLANAATLVNTILRNRWTDRIHLYHNAVGYESSRVRMRSTNTKINLSNMFITNSTCSRQNTDKNTNGTAEHRREEPEEEEEDEADEDVYGVDYMETVSLDQVMRTLHPDITRVQVMKIDVETTELQVLNGALGFLCHAIVERIIVEVQFLKLDDDAKGCRFESMRELMIRLGYDLYDYKERTLLTNASFGDMTGDILLVLRDMDHTPAWKLRHLDDRSNPCHGRD